MTRVAARHATAWPLPNPPEVVWRRVALAWRTFAPGPVVAQPTRVAVGATQGAATRHTIREEQNPEGLLLLTFGEVACPSSPSSHATVRPGKIEPDPITAALVQEAVSRVLRGETVGTVIADWNRRGVASPRGARWQTTPLRKILLNPVIAGLRVHRGEVIGDGAWEAIITRGEHERLQAAFGDKAARRRQGRGRTYLLSGGLAVCGECEVELYSARRNGGVAVYACRTDAGGCGGVQIRAADLEWVISEGTIDALSGPKLAKLLAEREDDEVDRLARQLHDDEEELKALARLHGQRRIEMGEWLAAREPVQQRIADTRAKVRQAPTADILLDTPRTEVELRKAWAERSVDWRRSRVALVLNHVTVFSAKRVGRKLQDRLDPDWKV